jgi:hypothetical protein
MFYKKIIYINNIMDRKRTNFISHKNVFNVDNSLSSKTGKYYQACAFKNPELNKFIIRRFLFNQDGDFLDIEERYYNDKQYKKFLETKKEHEYKLYPTYDLKTAKYPSIGELLIAMSDNINNNISAYDFAPF